MLNPVQGIAYRYKGFSLAVQKTHAQCCRSTGTAVIGGAAAKSQYDFSGTIFQGVADQLPHAVGAGLPRIQFFPH